MLIKRSPNGIDLPYPSEITPRAVFESRRSFIRQLAVGSIAARLTAMLPDVSISPETEATVTLWKGTQDIVDSVGGTASGRELLDSGFAEDVMIATEVDATDVVPVLMDGAFVPLGHRVAAARGRRNVGVSAR